MPKPRTRRTKYKFVIPHNCSAQLRTYINKLDAFVASDLVPVESLNTIQMPHHPATAVGGPIIINKLLEESASLEQILFKPTVRYLTSRSGGPKFRAHTLQQAQVVNLRPVWTLETIMSCLMTWNGQKHAVRPGSEVGVFLFLDKLTWEQLTGSIYKLYSDYRDYHKIYNHWTIYPCLMCDRTHPQIFREIRNRVSKPSRIYIVEHAIRLRRVPAKFFSWVRREGAYILLQNYRPNTAADRIAQGLTPFLDEAITY